MINIIGKSERVFASLRCASRFDFLTYSYRTCIIHEYTMCVRAKLKIPVSDEAHSQNKLIAYCMILTLRLERSNACSTLDTMQKHSRRID
jgi:hypothetical protein